MKKLLKWGGIGIVVVLVIAAIGNSGKPKPGAASSVAAQSGPASGEQDSAAAAPSPVYKTTAQQLFADYEANEVATDEKMKGMTLEISGTVQSIDKDFTDSIVIKLRTSNEFLPVQLSVDDSQKGRAIALKKGSKVVLRCDKASRIAGSAFGRGCEFVG
jgi:hypothetical protein